jgi:protein-arginine kinase activator protein McsA
MNVKSEEDFTFMESMTELEALEFKLSIAEENQQFELAAELRDKIKKIKDNGGK